MMMSMTASTRRFMWTSAAIAIIAALSFVIYHFRTSLPYSIDRSLVGNPEIVLSLSDVEVVGRDDGVRMWSFKAGRADITRGRTRTTLLGIKDGRLYSDDKVVATVQAGKAIYDEPMGNVEVVEGVRVKSPGKYSVETDRALWSGYFRQLRCPGKVVFRSGNSHLAGTNLRADARQQVVTLSKGRLTVDMDDLPQDQ